MPTILNVKPDNPKSGGRRCRAQAVTHAAGELGWRELHDPRRPPERCRWAIAWVDVAERGFYKKMKAHQKVNHFPRIEELTRKRQLGAHLNRMARQRPADFAFFPRTWVLPQDYSRLRAHMRELEDAAAAATKPWFIVKPDSACEGRGIFLTRAPATALDADVACVVQSYIERPLLVRERKFDMRVYVLLTSASPLTVYVYHEGLARFCSEAYAPPAAVVAAAIAAAGASAGGGAGTTAAGTDDGGHLVAPVGCDADTIGQNALFGHVTNFALNKQHRDYVSDERDHDAAATESGGRGCDDGGDDGAAAEDGDGGGVGNKWKLSALFEALARRGIDGAALWARVCDCVVRALIAVQPTLAHAYRLNFPHDTYGGACFQLLGCDVMLSADGAPTLLEVNRNPSLKCSDSSLDMHVKRALLVDTLRLLDARAYMPAAAEAAAAEEAAAARQAAKAAAAAEEGARPRGDGGSGDGGGSEKIALTSAASAKHNSSGGSRRRGGGGGAAASAARNRLAGPRMTFAERKAAEAAQAAVHRAARLQHEARVAAAGWWRRIYPLPGTADGEQEASSAIPTPDAASSASAADTPAKRGPTPIPDCALTTPVTTAAEYAELLECAAAVFQT